MNSEESVDHSNVITLLQNELKKRKKINPQFSLRGFAKKLNMSPAQLSQILNGKRNLTAATLAKIATTLSLSPSMEEKLYMDAFSKRKKFDQDSQRKRSLREDEFALIGQWYHYAILSLARLPKAKADPEWIAQRLGVSKIQAAGALKRLLRLGIIEEGKYLKQRGPFLSAQSEVPSLAIQKYHQEILQMAELRLSKIPLEERDYSSITFLANPKKIPLARLKIEKFQDELAEFLGDENASEVYILANQLFSLEGKYV